MIAATNGSLAALYIIIALAVIAWAVLSLIITWWFLRIVKETGRFLRLAGDRIEMQLRQQYPRTPVGR